MATTTGTCVVFDNIKNWLGDNTINLDTDSLGMLLLNSTQEPNRATDTYVDDISVNELLGNGYSRKVLSGVTWTTSGGANGQMMLDANNPVWTAAGGSIIARWWVLFNNTPAADSGKHLLAYGLLDDTPADVTATDTNTITVGIHAMGFFTVG